MAAAEHNFSLVSGKSVFFKADTDVWYQGVEIKFPLTDILNRYSESRYRSIRIVRSSLPSDQTVGTVAFLTKERPTIAIDPSLDLGPMPDFT